MGQPERQKDAVENAVVLGVCALWTPLTVNVFFLERLQWGCVSWSQGATVLVSGAGLGHGKGNDRSTVIFDDHWNNEKLILQVVITWIPNDFNYLESTCRIFHHLISSDVAALPFGGLMPPRHLCTPWCTRLMKRSDGKAVGFWHRRCGQQPWAAILQPKFLKHHRLPLQKVLRCILPV